MLGQVSSMHGGDFGGHICEFLHALESLDDSGHLKHPRALVSLSPPPTKAQVKAQKRSDNKEERLQRQLPLINLFLQQGDTATYIDGSSNHYDMIGWVGGFVVFVHTERPLSNSHPVPAECHQTNSGSELYAVYYVLTNVIPILELDKIVIITDSEYVFKGVLGGAAKWRRHDWRGACGPVADSWLWAKVLALLVCAG